MFKGYQGSAAVRSIIAFNDVMSSKYGFQQRQLKWTLDAAVHAMSMFES